MPRSAAFISTAVTDAAPAANSAKLLSPAEPMLRQCRPAGFSAAVNNRESSQHCAYRIAEKSAQCWISEVLIGAGMLAQPRISEMPIYQTSSRLRRVDSG